MNSFELNQTDGADRLFPLGFTLLKPRNGVHAAYLHAQGLSEVTDILLRYTQDLLCVFNVSVEKYSWTGSLPEFEEVIKSLGLLSGLHDHNSAGLHKADLPQLLRKLKHWELCLLDGPATLGRQRMYDIARATQDREVPEDGFVLDGTPESRVYIDSHDDCYVYLETRSPDQIHEHFARLLQEFVSSLAFIQVSRVKPPQRSLLQNLLSTTGSCTMFDTHAEVTDTLVKLHYSEAQYELGMTFDRPATSVEYDLIKGSWLAG